MKGLLGLSSGVLSDVATVSRRVKNRTLGLGRGDPRPSTSLKAVSLSNGGRPTAGIRRLTDPPLQRSEESEESFLLHGLEPPELLSNLLGLSPVALDGIGQREGIPIVHQP